MHYAAIDKLSKIDMTIAPQDRHHLLNPGTFRRALSIASGLHGAEIMFRHYDEFNENQVQMPTTMTSHLGPA
ncbi:MAG: hypothetical protein PHS32_04910 [Rhodoferax sp.]|uniref:hypothetical protein n=1 Tax=Rhodoferax sp. TaxID=50421 RepID=UPI0026354E25|nr:hypothetical protein [Rhodoferax sp.]MDD5333068.1 hypothetical protein [Rhodoferax sp.]